MTGFGQAFLKSVVGVLRNCFYVLVAGQGRSEGVKVVADSSLMCLLE